MILSFSPHFKRLMKKLPVSLRPLIKNRIELFQADPFHPSLNTHKLQGDLKSYWSFSIDRKHRIVFEFDGDDSVCFLSVGDHSVYR